MTPNRKKQIWRSIQKKVKETAEDVKTYQGVLEVNKRALEENTEKQEISKANTTKVCKIEMKPSIDYSKTCFHFRMLSEENMNKKLTYQNFVQILLNDK